MNKLIALGMFLTFAFSTILVVVGHANYGAIIFGTIFGGIAGINIDKEKLMNKMGVKNE